MTDFNNNESTGEDFGPEYKEWISSVMNATDPVTQRSLIRDRLLTSEELSVEDKKIFKDVFEYCEKIVSLNKQLEPNLLKIYLQDIKGYNIEQVNIIRIFMLLGLCGFSF